MARLTSPTVKNIQAFILLATAILFSTQASGARVSAAVQPTVFSFGFWNEKNDWLANSLLRGKIKAPFGDSADENAILSACDSQSASLPGGNSDLADTIAEMMKTQRTIRLELFTMTQCPFGVKAEQVLAPILEKYGSRIELRLSFLGRIDAASGKISSLHGQDEIDESARQLAIARLFPRKLMAYILARAENYKSDEWQQAAKKSDINPTELERFAASEEGYRLFEENVRRSISLGVDASPTVFLNGEKFEGRILPRNYSIKAADAAPELSACNTNTDCNDFNACTTNTCVEGLCRFTPITCPSNSCANAACSSVRGCFTVALNCSDSDPCTRDICNENGAGCEHVAPASTLLIANQPGDQIVQSGATVVFTTHAANANSVQWQVSTDNGASFSDITGATATRYAFTATAAQSGNRYRAVFSQVQTCSGNGYSSSLISDFATLAVNALTVTTDADTNDGACDANCSLREAVAAANLSSANDAIVFSPAFFSVPRTVTLGTELEIAASGSLTIFGREGIIISGDDQTRVFSINTGATLTVKNLTITRGKTVNAEGGCILNNGDLTLIESKVSACNALGAAGNGGGIGSAGNLNLIRSQVSDGGAASGGGIFSTGGALNLENSTVSANSAGNRGGVFKSGNGVLSLNYSTVSGNTAAEQGGGIYSASPATLTRSTVSGNAAALGGGVFADNLLTMSYATVSGNTASNQGGGIYHNAVAVRSGGADSTNSTIAFNTATNSGGGVFDAANSRSFSARRTIFSGNNANPATTRDFVGELDSKLGNIFQQSSGGLGDRVNTAVPLAPLGNYGGPTFTHALLSGSPAIDVFYTAENSDQRNAPVSGMTDAGAFEFGAIGSAALPTGSIATSYNQTLVADTSGATYALQTGNLPPGLNLTTSFRNGENFGDAPTAALVLTGTPTATGVYNFVLRGDNGGNLFDTNYQIAVFAPTAAGVAVSGRVLTFAGLPVRNAIVSLTGSNGATRTAVTNYFGYYGFIDVPAGETYVFHVRAKRYQFAPQAVYVSEQLNELDFTALP